MNELNEVEIREGKSHVLSDDFFSSRHHYTCLLVLIFIDQVVVPLKRSVVITMTTGRQVPAIFSYHLVIVNNYVA